jgi:hypothetical protein
MIDRHLDVDVQKSNEVVHELIAKIANRAAARAARALDVLFQPGSQFPFVHLEAVPVPGRQVAEDPVYDLIDWVHRSSGPHFLSERYWLRQHRRRYQSPERVPDGANVMRMRMLPSGPLRSMMSLSPTRGRLRSPGRPDAPPERHASDAPRQGPDGESGGARVEAFAGPPDLVFDKHSASRADTTFSKSDLAE